MGRQGQASIMVAIIFQVVFIFFAMVINVGLIVHDKINLQNSVDIAAYYGAMKQAEGLNTIGHLNFQLRQAWKLLAWRLWSISSAGRNRTWEPNSPGSDSLYEYLDKDNKVKAGNRPVVCIFNAFWRENYTSDGKSFDQNACHNPGLVIPELKPYVPNPLMLAIPGIAVLDALARKEIAQYNQSCTDYGGANYNTAAAFLLSYKVAMLRRRDAIKNIQKNMISDKDISGSSIKDIAERTFRKNLTTGNQAGEAQFEYSNSLDGQPFLTPIEVFTYIEYQDYKGGCSGDIHELSMKPSTASNNPYPELYQAIEKIYGADFAPKGTTLQEFSGEQDQSVWRSTVGVEKNPWTLAYVKVRATSRPPLLFSPGLRPIELVAEGYAMPFGGRIGPWYRNRWPKSAVLSGGEKIDAKLPLRLGEGNGQLPSPPNYSRFAGDPFGMQSQMAQNLGNINASGKWPDMPSLNTEYLDFTDSKVYKSPELDLVVAGKNFSKLRTAEIAAISPDVFDAFYYSINTGFGQFINGHGQPGFIQSSCKPFCPSDYGSAIPLPQQQMGSGSVEGQIKLASNLYAPAQWMIKSPEHVNTGWSHKVPDEYPDAREVVAKQTKEGGRSGYSVKIVSKKYLQGEMTLGGAGVRGSISNPPQ